MLARSNEQRYKIIQCPVTDTQRGCLDKTINFLLKFRGHHRCAADNFSGLLPHGGIDTIISGLADIIGSGTKMSVFLQKSFHRQTAVGHLSQRTGQVCGNRGEGIHYQVALIFADHPCLHEAAHKGIADERQTSRGGKRHRAVFFAFFQHLANQAHPVTSLYFFDKMSKRCPVKRIQIIYFRPQIGINRTVIPENILRKSQKSVMNLSGLIRGETTVFERTQTLPQIKIITGEHNLEFRLVMQGMICPQLCQIPGLEAFMKNLRDFTRYQRQEGQIHIDIRLVQEAFHQRPGKKIRIP